MADLENSLCKKELAFVTIDFFDVWILKLQVISSFEFSSC